MVHPRRPLPFRKAAAPAASGNSALGRAKQPCPDICDGLTTFCVGFGNGVAGGGVGRGFEHGVYPCERVVVLRGICAFTGLSTNETFQCFS